MELKLDTSKTYAIALEGGGAKGAYEIGVWKALEQAGVKYNAVSGTSVGALNGALMTMRDLTRGIACWRDIHLNKVMDLGALSEDDVKQMMSGQFENMSLTDIFGKALDIVRNRGLDVAPLRAWVREVVDVKRVKESDVQLYISTVSLTDRKGLEVHVNELPEEEICDMLLASAYHPSFRLEKLGGKYYTDGGFVDSLPLHALVEAGYKDIIAVRIPGIGHERKFKMPDDVNLTVIHSWSDLGHVLNFDSEQARRDIEIGYLDGKRALYGLAGHKYYMEREMTEREALAWILDHQVGGAICLREFLEEELPRQAKHFELEDWDYYDLMTCLLEQRAEQKGIDPLEIRKDRELADLAE